MEVDGWNVASAELPELLLGPLDDPARVSHHLTPVGDHHRHGPLAGEFFDLAAARGHHVEEPGPDAEPAHLDDLGVVARHPQCLVRVVAGVAMWRARRLEGAPADVELHDTAPYYRLPPGCLPIGTLLR